MDCGHEIKAPANNLTIEYSKLQLYTPKFIADKILTSHGTIEGERKLVTVLFADVANFTSIAERLDPEDVHEIMDGCFRILSQIIHQNEGTINQFTGDGVMALFGAPIAHEEHAQRACQAALAIQSSIAEYSAQIERKFQFKFKLRIGLNTGLVVVGGIGDDLRMDYTAVGDTTNLASRLENMANPGGTLISRNTQRLVKAYFKLNALSPVSVKGKEKPQEVFELIEANRVKTRLDASISRGLTKFVGRENSMAMVNNAWVEASSGVGQVLGIVGEAGVGKSRLLLEFRRSLPVNEFIYFEGRCFQHGGSIAFLPFLKILKSCFGIDEGSAENAMSEKVIEKLKVLNEDMLRPSLPAFHDLLSMRFEDKTWHKLDPQVKRENIFEAIRDLLVSISQKKPLVMAIEDLHWIDKTSEEFLSYFIDNLPHCSILLILLYRAEYTHQWGGKSHYTNIGVRLLNAESSSELISNLLDGSKVGADLEQLILNQTAGQPLFIEEFTNSLREDGLIKRQGDKYVPESNFTEVQVPDTIQGIIASRMDRLDENLKRTLQVASVVGRDFSFRILQAVSGIKADLKSYLISLQKLEFIYVTQVFPELEYIFKHVLTQEVSYQSLLLKKRQKLHEKIGLALEQLYGGRLEEFYEILAHHYARSHNSEKAIKYLKLSGQKSMRKNSAWEALDYFEKAIVALERLPDSTDHKREKLEVIYLMISPLITLGFPAKSLSILKKGEKLAKDLSDQRRLYRFQTNLGFLYSSNGNYHEARPYIERAFRAAKKLNDVSLLGQVVTDLDMIYLTTGDHMRTVKVMAEVIYIIETNERQSDFFGGPINVYSALHSLSGLSLGWIGKFKRACLLCEKGNHSATVVNDARTLGMCHYLHGIVLGFKGELDSAIEHFEAAIKFNEKLAHAIMLPGSYSRLGFIRALAGDLEVGRRHAEEGLKIQLELGYNYLGSMGWFSVGACLTESGEFEDAIRNLEKGLEISRKNQEKIIEGALLIWLGRARGRCFPPLSEGAAQHILLGIEISKELSQKPDLAIGYLFLAELYATRNRNDLALDNLNKSMVLFEEMEMQYWPDKAKKILARIQEN